MNTKMNLQDGVRLNTSKDDDATHTLEEIYYNIYS
jgi:hypothetical protein